MFYLGAVITYLENVDNLFVSNYPNFKTSPLRSNIRNLSSIKKSHYLFKNL